MVRKLNRFVKVSCVSAVVAAALGAAPTAALAGRFDTHRDHDRRSHDRHDHRGGGGYVDISIGGRSRGPVVPPPVCDERVWVAPVYRTVCEQRWVEPVYRTVCDRVWIEPVTRIEYERVWVADRYEWRNVEHCANGRTYVSREYVLVERAHWADVPRTIVITPGHYEDRPRQELVCAGHFETVERLELISPGHWEVRRVVVARPPRYEESHARINLRFPL